MTVHNHKEMKDRNKIRITYLKTDFKTNKKLVGTVSWQDNLGIENEET